MTAGEPGGPKTSGPMIDYLHGKVPEWFTDEDWRRLVKEWHDEESKFDNEDPARHEVGDRYYSKLGLTLTNNTHLWYSNKPPKPDGDDDLEVYLWSLWNIDAPLNDDVPGISQLRQLRHEYPDLFDEMASLDSEVSGVMKELVGKIKEKGEISQDEYVDSEVLRLKAAACMEKILNLMRQSGVTEEQIGMLGR